MMVRVLKVSRSTKELMVVPEKVEKVEDLAWVKKARIGEEVKRGNIGYNGSGEVFFITQGRGCKTFHPIAQVDLVRMTT